MGDSTNRGVAIGFWGEAEALPTKPNLFGEAVPARGVPGAVVAGCCSGTLSNNAARELILGERMAD